MSRRGTLLMIVMFFHFEVVVLSHPHLPPPPSLPSPLLPRRALLQQQQQPQNDPTLTPLDASDGGGGGNAAAAAAFSSSSSTSPAEVATDAAKVPTDCMPPNTVVVVWANRHHRHLFSAQIKNVQQRDCFMSRFVFVALDGFMYKHCQELAKGGIKIRCARSTATSRESEEEEDDDRELSPDALAAHMSTRWAEIASIVTRDTNAWAFDVDVAILDVPPLAEAMAMEGSPATCCTSVARRTRRRCSPPQTTGTSWAKAACSAACRVKCSSGLATR
jgi:hypothetical protein